MDEQRYWQLAWSEYKRRRLVAERKYRSHQTEQAFWMKTGHELYRSLIDPQLFIEALFARKLTEKNIHPPQLAEVGSAINTIALWYDESWLPDAEREAWAAGNKLNSMMLRYPDTTIAYWLSQDPTGYPAYFHLLYLPLGTVSREILHKGAGALKDIPTIRALDRYGIWPEDLHERLTALRSLITEDVGPQISQALQPDPEPALLSI